MQGKSQQRPDAEKVHLIFLKLISNCTKCYPSDRDWSNGQKCSPCERGGLPCGPNVPFSGSLLPHGSGSLGRGSRPSPVTVLTTADTTRPLYPADALQRTPPHDRLSTAHNRDADVSPLSAGSSAGLSTASLARATLNGPTPGNANNHSQNCLSSSERCEVLICRRVILD